MEIIFIGTGSGKTTLNRDHSSIAFRDNSGKIILIDAGDGISKALLKQAVSFDSIDSIFITHFHPDHFAGLASLIAQMKLNSRVQPLNLFVHINLVETTKQYLNTFYLFEEVFDFPFYIIGYDFDKTFQILSDFIITPLPNSHVKNKHSVDYPANNFVSSSLSISSKDNSIIYTSDVGSDSDLEIFKSQPCQLLIAETTHLSLETIKNFAEQKTIPKVILTHLDDSDIEKIKNWCQQNEGNANSEFLIAYDGLRISM